MLTRSVALVCLCIGVIPGALASVKKAAQLAEREMLQWTVTSSKDFVCQSVWQVNPDGSVDDAQQSGTAVESDRNLCLHRDRAVFLKRNRFNQINAMYRRIVIDLAGVKFLVNFERKLTEADLAAQAIADYLVAFVTISGPGIEETAQQKLARIANPIEIVDQQARLHQLRFVVPKGWKGRISADSILFTRTRQGPRINVSVKALNEDQLAAGLNTLLLKILPDDMLETLAENQPNPKIIQMSEPSHTVGLHWSSATTEIDKYTFFYRWYVDPETDKAYTFYTWWRTKKKNNAVREVFATIVDSVERVTP